MKKQILLSAVLACISVFSAAAQKEPVDYVNPFVGTTNYGTTNPGALTPHGMMSVTPFNVMGVPEGGVYGKVLGTSMQLIIVSVCRALQPFYYHYPHPACKIRVFAIGFDTSPPTRVTINIDSRRPHS